MGLRARLLHDDRRRQGGGRSSRSDPEDPRSRHRQHRPDARPARPRSARRGRLSPLRPGRRRAFRQDGAQRHRIRGHAGLRRGLRHIAQRQHSGSPGKPALQSRPSRHRRGVAAGQRDCVLAARSDRDLSGERPRALQIHRPGRRFRARAAGPSRPRSRRRCRPRCCPRRSTPVSARARTTPLPSASCRRCATSSAATRNREQW